MSATSYLVGLVCLINYIQSPCSTSTAERPLGMDDNALCSGYENPVAVFTCVVENMENLYSE